MMTNENSSANVTLDEISHGMGPLVGKTRYDHLPGVIAAVLGAILFILAAILDLNPFFLYVSALTGLFGLISVARALASPWMSVHEEGVIRRRGRGVEYCRWSDVADGQFWQSSLASSGIAHKHELRAELTRQDGRRFVIRHVTPKMAAAIERGIAHQLLPQATRHLASGQALSFGPLELSTRGLSQGSEKIPWSEIEHVELANSGGILVHLKGQDVKTINTEGLRDVQLLLALAEEQLKTQS